MMTKSPKKRAGGLLLGAVLLACSWGCSSLGLFSERFQSPDGTLVIESGNPLISDLAVPYGMFPVTVEGVGMIAGLPDTGSDPAPSPHRSQLRDDMKARGVENPNVILASKKTSLVVVRGVLPPGVQSGDPFDIEVRVLDGSETTSLRGGWLLETRLKEMKLLDDNQIHEGRVWGQAKGAILVDPSAGAEKNPILSCRGRILGGGRASKTRSLGLVLREGKQNEYYAAQIANAINRRFYNTTPGGIQEGVAKAHTNQYVEISVHARYKDNIPRYMQVVRAIALRESPVRRIERMALLEKQLLDPITSAHAALQLEAIGRDGIDAIKKGLTVDDVEVRFRAAEALAYLDDSAAAETLGRVARDEPAFRVFALSALAAMNDPVAYEQLCKLLDSPSAETRYGAFRALWTMNPTDHRVLGEKLAEDFNYHVLATSGPPMIHVTRSHRPELVLFGEEQRLATPLLLEAGPRIRLRNVDADRIAVSRFAVGEPDQKRIVSTKLDDVIRAVAELGGTYPDVVQALQQAKVKGVLPSRLEVDALPAAGRRYERTAESDATAAGRAPNAESHSPFAFFTRSREKSTPSETDPVNISDRNPAEDGDSSENNHPARTFFAKMTGQDSD